MVESEMGPMTKQLCNQLREAIHLLECAREEYWREWLEKSLLQIERRDLAGVQRLLEAFGGSGSFSDLSLSESNGHSIPEGQYALFNQRLEFLRTRLYELGREIMRNAVEEE